MRATSSGASGSVPAPKRATTRPRRSSRYLLKFHSGAPAAAVRRRKSGLARLPTTVVGEHANPLFRRLTAAAGAPDWNFNKYLVDRRGRVVARFGAGTEPDAPELVARIERLL